MEGLVRRWQGHGWSRLSHGVHTGGGPARITVTLVSVGPHNIAGVASLPLPPGPCAIFSPLNKLMVEAAGLLQGKTICTQRPAVTTKKPSAQMYLTISVYRSDLQLNEVRPSFGPQSAMMVNPDFKRRWEWKRYTFVGPEGAAPLWKTLQGQSMGTSKLGERRQRAIDRATHKQRTALGDREQRAEKDAQRLKRDLEPWLKPNCHEKMRVAMATQEPPSKHVSRGGSGARGLGLG